MKSNAQLRCDDQDDNLPPPPIHVEMPDIASSSQIASLPSQQDPVMHRFWRLWLLYRGHKFYAANCLFYAASDVIYAA
jgi:hypothetical protein